MAATTCRSRARWARSATSPASVARAGARAGRRRGAARDPGAADRRAVRPPRRRCWSSRTCTGRTTRRSMSSPCSGGGSRRYPRCSCSRSAAARCRPPTRSTPRSAPPAPARRRSSSSPALAWCGRITGRRRRGELHAVTGGNPFYVTELLAARPAADLPPSVANAVLGRAARLDDAARGLLELVSVVPHRVGTGVLDAVMPGWAAAAEQPERRQLLEVGPAHVRFRHELARHAIRASLPIARRRRLHTEILGALLAADADPADIVHHAEAAGDAEVVADYALVAARRAAALDSNREAYSHFARAADFADRLPQVQQAALAEELAQAAYNVNRPEAAFAAMERSIALHRELGDQLAVGRCTRILSRFHWYAGDGDAARRTARAAVAILERHGESVELARAYSGALAARDARRAPRGGDRVGWARARARHPARRRVDPRACADQRRQRQARDRSARDRRSARGARDRGRRRRPPRGGAGAAQPRLLPDHLGGRRSRRSATRASGSPTRASTRCTRWPPTPRRWSRGCSSAPARGTEAERLARAELGRR